MTGRRTSARQAARAASQPSASPNNRATVAGVKRKAQPASQGRSKRGKKGKQEEQSTIEESISVESKEQPKGVGATDQPRSSETNEAGNIVTNGRSEGTGDDPPTRKAEDGSDKDGAETARRVEEKTRIESNSAKQFGQKQDARPKQNGLEKLMHKEEEGTKETAEGTGSKVTAQDDAVEDSSKRESVIPSNILEKGIIYFFFRGRVGIDEPSAVNEVARSYIVLRPLPHGAKLGEGPIGDAGTNRMLALPKKVLPVSPRDRPLIFVSKANCTMDDIKEQLSSSEYATKTTGVRHTPAAAPIGEGVYAITQTGRETHLAYILTIPAEIDEVQRGIGLKRQGSYITSAKNPQSSAPANAGLPKGADYPQEIIDEFRGRG